MAGLYGDSVANHVVQGVVHIDTTQWTPLIAGSTILENRRHVRIFGRGKPGNAIGLAYSPINADGTYTAPTDNIGSVTMYPGNTRFVEPVSNKVQVYGRLQAKAASTDGALKVIVTEYR